jgi:hypothetical protein
MVVLLFRPSHERHLYICVLPQCSLEYRSDVKRMQNSRQIVSTWETNASVERSVDVTLIVDAGPLTKALGMVKSKDELRMSATD